jgi:hypothetical protein
MLHPLQSHCEGWDENLPGCSPYSAIAARLASLLRVLARVSHSAANSATQFYWQPSTPLPFFVACIATKRATIELSKTRDTISFLILFKVAASWWSRRLE